jgi:hypothetical protein
MRSVYATELLFEYRISSGNSLRPSRVTGRINVELNLKQKGGDTMNEPKLNKAAREYKFEVIREMGRTLEEVEDFADRMYLIANGQVDEEK